ncbi:septum site-determining protein MinC [Allochromatium humboldtianum]|jgi:septum site-determining protein MinC|uniref:Probable septum site-determining protein MinC n=1 Tax=Allochromatium humboldtianum TaxID=504901 RepID=A0A850RGD1_9GAMM|nr:septum site-determining protein MinC [Allochromatium humboldtianum]NVZ10222.1 septum site-determining protein MinC [Allochromatium humboldtianum]
MAAKSTSSTNASDGAGTFELKAASFTLPIIRLLDSDIETVASRLGAKVEKAPDFFRNTPVVIDLSDLPRDRAPIALPQLVGLLRGYGMIPFGVRGANAEQTAAAEALELAILRESYVRRTKSVGELAAETELEPDPVTAPKTAQAPEKAQPSAETTQPRAAGQSGFMLITKPVRSGQRIYAAGGDLSIIAPVSSGAELMADGNIHVYGPLRGRALAGMSGNMEARIFCHDLQAELISIAGHYRVSEGIPNELRGVPVQIFLDQKILRIEKL